MVCLMTRQGVFSADVTGTAPRCGPLWNTPNRIVAASCGRSSMVSEDFPHSLDNHRPTFVMRSVQELQVWKISIET